MWTTGPESEPKGVFIATQLNWTELNSTDPVEQRTAKSVVFLFMTSRPTNWVNCCSRCRVEFSEFSWVESSCVAINGPLDCKHVWRHIMTVGLRRTLVSVRYGPRSSVRWSPLKARCRRPVRPGRTYGPDVRPVRTGVYFCTRTYGT